MSDGQWRVLILVVLLAVLELVGNKGAQGFFAPFATILQRGFAGA